MQSLQRVWSKSRNMSKPNCVAPTRVGRYSSLHPSYPTCCSPPKLRICTRLVIFWLCSLVIVRYVSFFVHYLCKYISSCQLGHFAGFEVDVKMLFVSKEHNFNEICIAYIGLHLSIVLLILLYQICTHRDHFSLRAFMMPLLCFYCFSVFYPRTFV